MTSVENVPQIDVSLPEPPRLLVEWSSPWKEFKSALAPALSRSPKPLAGEARTGLFPYRGLLASWICEILLLWLVIVLPSRLESLRPYSPPPLPKYDVLYYYGDELPQTQDNAGAQAGRSGSAGGSEAHHRTQAIRVARGDRPADKVVDAPKVNLPRSDSAVANLLAFKPLAGPPPTEGLRSSLVAPALPTTVVPPTPELNSSLSRNANGLNPPIVPPAPEISHANTRSISALASSVIAPAPNVARDKLRTALPVTPSVIAPAPSDAQRDLASSRVPLTQTTNVVAPPVSAPQRDIASSSRLTLPAPAVVAPPPSQVSRDLNSWGGSPLGNIRSNPVPPPPSTAATSGALSARGGIAGLTPQAVPPPVSAGGAGMKGTSGGRLAGTLVGSAEVVPPPPGLGGGKYPSGTGLGSKGAGNGSLLDLGTAAAPPATKGNASGSTGSPSAPASGATGQSAVVVSSHPGPNVGIPNSSGGGAIAMSPSGTAKAGIGGSGGGSGIGKGGGPGSGLSGDGSGAAKEGAGRGSDPSARAGISPYPGPGGAGRGANGSPAMPGVSVQGGNTITLPSFGPPGAEPSSGPGHSSVNDHKHSGITIVATSRSGGVFGGSYYGALKGDRVYSIYLDTSLGTAVMQFADPASTAHPYAEDLTAPEPIRKDLPQGIRSTHVVFVGILSRSGEFKDLKVLDPGAAEATSKLLAALPNWKFRPAFRGNEPVEVNVILGFGVDTR